MRYLVLVLLYLIPATSKAQGSFAPDGAVWYYDAHYGSITKGWVAGDTVIDGEKCKRINQEILSHDNTVVDTQFLVYPKRLFVHERNDTVFYFNEEHHLFAPLYIFNVTEGDTICLPTPFHYQWSPQFCFVVDSIRLVQYDTAMLKTVYTRSLTAGKQQEPVAVYSYSDTGLTGAYAERIGALGGFGLYPRCAFYDCPIYLTAASLFYTKFLRCYDDPQYAIHRAATCDPLSVPELNRSGFCISPNPANDRVTLSFKDRLAVEMDIQFMDITGRIVLYRKLMTLRKEEQFDLSAMNSGVYLLLIKNEGVVIGKEKIVVQH